MVPFFGNPRNHVFTIVKEVIFTSQFTHSMGKLKIRVYDCMSLNFKDKLKGLVDGIAFINAIMKNSLILREFL